MIYIFLNDCNIIVPDLIDNRYQRICKQFSKLEDEEYIIKELNKIKPGINYVISLSNNQILNMDILEIMAKHIDPINPITLVNSFMAIRGDYYADITNKTIKEFSKILGNITDYETETIDKYFSKLRYYEIKQTRDEIKAVRSARSLFQDINTIYGDVENNIFETEDDFLLDFWSNLIGVYDEIKPMLIPHKLASEKTIASLEYIDTMRLKYYREQL